MESENKHFIDIGKEIKIIVKYLKSGTKLKYDIYDEDGNLVQPAYISFEQSKINDLLQNGIETLYYSKLEEDYKFSPSQFLIEQLDRKQNKENRSIRKETHKKGILAMEKIIKMVQMGEDLDFKDAKTFVEMVLDDVNSLKDNIINLLSLKIYDDYTYTHSINTGIIAMIFAKYLNKSDNNLLDIGLGGFLHDIGKLKVPYDLIHKKEPLSKKEFDIIRKHTVYGYELVKENSQLSHTVKDIILLHHEKFDGTGYPFHYDGERISDEICIVALAEAYDTLTSSHPYQRAVSAIKTFELLLTDSDRHFKKNITQFFCEKMTHLDKEDQYAVEGSFILLNSKEIAKVISENKSNPYKPHIQILIKDSKALSKPLDVDLKLDTYREITRVLTMEEENELKKAMNLK